MLGLKAKEGLSTRTQLSNLLLSLTRGGTGNSRTGSSNASNVAFGEMERGNHRQIHHRQLLQSNHDICKGDRANAQCHMNAVLIGTVSLGKFRLKSCRERQQRWMVNGLYCLYMVNCLEQVKTKDGEEALVMYARRMYEYSEKWRKQAASDVVVMLLMPEIRVALYFRS